MDDLLKIKILEDFGFKLTKICFDESFTSPNEINLKYLLEYWDTLTNTEKKILQDYFFSMSQNILPSIMLAFVESFMYSDNCTLDLCYIDQSLKSMNLKELSDNLVAEPVLDNGWLDNYSSVYKEGYIFHLKD